MTDHTIEIMRENTEHAGDVERIASVIREWIWLKRRVSGEGRDSSEHFDVMGIEEAAKRIAALRHPSGVTRIGEPKAMTRERAEELISQLLIVVSAGHMVVKRMRQWKEDDLMDNLLLPKEQVGALLDHIADLERRARAGSSAG